MVVRVISDLHINVKKLENDFLIESGKFISYIDDICSKSNLVVINGDLFELWETTKWKRHLVHFRKIVENNFDIVGILLKYILSGKIIYINGNHDEVIRLKNILPITNRFVLDHHNTRIVFEHGHMGDITNSKYSIIGKIQSFVVGFLERFYDKDIDLKLIEIGKKLSTGIDESAVYRYAQKLQKQYEADVVVFGHTHNGMIKTDNGLCYVNTGKGCDRLNALDETTITIEKDGYKVEQKTISL